MDYARPSPTSTSLLNTFTISVNLTSQIYLLGTGGLFTEGWRPVRAVSGSVGGTFEMDASDWSKGIQYQIFDTRPDAEFKPNP